MNIQKRACNLLTAILSVAEQIKSSAKPYQNWSSFKFSVELLRVLSGIFTQLIQKMVEIEVLFPPFLIETIKFVPVRLALPFGGSELNVNINSAII